MADLKDRTKLAFSEARLLILGTQLLVGLGLRATFQPGFERLPPAGRALHLGAVVATLAALAMLMAPAAQHHLAEGGGNPPRLYRFLDRMVTWALIPFAAGLGVTACLAVVALTRAGEITAAAAGAGVGTCLLAVGCWYGPRAVARPPADGPDPAGSAPSADAGDPPMQQERQAPRGTAAEDNPGAEGNSAVDGADRGGGDAADLKDKIEQALIETRMVLPGVQALLGFQFLAVLTEAFDQLPHSLRVVHVASLGLTALTTVLLVSPAAFHRIVERGGHTPRQHRLTGRFILAAMATFAPALTGDLYVVLHKVSGSAALAGGAAGGVLAGFYGLWFALPLWLRWRDRRGGHSGR